MAIKKPTPNKDVVGGIGLIVVSYGLTLIVGYTWGSSNGAKDALAKRERQERIASCYERGFSAVKGDQDQILCAHTDSDPIKTFDNDNSSFWIFKNNTIRTKE